MIDFSGFARVATSARAGLAAMAMLASSTAFAAEGGVFGHATPGQMKLI